MGKIVEVDEEQLIADRKLRGYVNALMANPKSKLEVQKAMKIVDPNASTPELDQHTASNEPLLAMEKKFDAFVEETKKEKSDRERAEKLAELDGRVNQGFAALRRDGWTTAGVDAVKNIMEEQGIVDVEIAAAYYEKKNPPPAPVTPGGTGAWGFTQMPADGADDLKQLLASRGENDFVVDKMAKDILNETRTAQRR